MFNLTVKPKESYCTRYAPAEILIRLRKELHDEISMKLDKMYLNIIAKR